MPRIIETRAPDPSRDVSAWIDKVLAESKDPNERAAAYFLYVHSPDYHPELKEKCEVESLECTYKRTPYLVRGQSPDGQVYLGRFATAPSWFDYTVYPSECSNWKPTYRRAQP